VLALAAGQGYIQEGTGSVREVADTEPVTDWKHWGNTAGGSRFSEADQINTETVDQLKEVWRFRTGVGEVFKSTPLQVGNRLYVCAANNIVIALDSDSGKEIWRHDPDIQLTNPSQYMKTCRGVGYHKAPQDYSGQCPERIVIGALDSRLIALDASTGKRCSDFGVDGVVDLTKGMGITHEYQYGITAPPLVAGDVLVVGGMVADTQELGMPSGVVRAFNVFSGDFAWAWDLGNPGVHTEPAAGETYTPGTPNVWTVMSYDAELDIVFAPTGNPPPDYYGGTRRPFDDAYSSSVVAIDAATGAERWKYQTVHHDIWDYDLPSQPVMVDVDRDGESVPSLVVPTKMGDIFLLDRRTGKQVFPMAEKPAPQNPEVGEYLSLTQPESALPNFHPYRHEKDMWGLTPIDQMVCRIEYKMMRYEGMYTPPSKVGPLFTGGTLVAPGNFGGFNWGSVSVDADNGLLIATPMLLAHRLFLFTPEQVAKAGPIARFLLGENHPAVRLDPDAPIPEPREPAPDNPFDHARINYYGMPQPFMSRLGTGVPCFEPPWSRIAVIDLNTRELLWSRPLGSMKEAGPFGIRSGLPFNVGVAVQGSTLTTRGGLTFMSSAMDSTVRAFDVRTGEVKWQSDLPGNGQSQPMTYKSKKTGKQHLIVTVPNPSWRYPRDPKTNTYVDSKGDDGKGGFVIAYALED
jgi:quinoprotein glucose dehydrogenase/quinate dehydrogenase (quinone)